MAHDDGRSTARVPERVNSFEDAGPTAEPAPPAESEVFGGESNPEVLPDREPWRAIVHGIGIGEQAIGAALLAVVLFLVVALVAQRYLPGVNFPQTGEVARLAMVWGTFLMAGYLMAHDRHIAIHVVDYVVAGRALAAVKLVVNLIVLVTCAVLLYATYLLVSGDIGQVTPAAEIPLQFVNAIPIIGFALTGLRAFLWIVMHDVPAVLGREDPA